MSFSLCIFLMKQKGFDLQVFMLFVGFLMKQKLNRENGYIIILFYELRNVCFLMKQKGFDLQVFMLFVGFLMKQKTLCPIRYIFNKFC